MSKNRSKIITFFSFLFLVITCLFGVGKSDWVLESTNYIGGITGNVAEAVCYSTNSNGTTYYTNIDGALDNIYNNGLSDTLYIIPSLGASQGSSDPWTTLTMNYDHTVERGDTFSLPYEGSTWRGENNDSGWTDTNIVQNSSGSNVPYYFADANATFVSKYKKIDFIIGSGKKLTINGTLNVGGKTNVATSTAVTGHTSSDYTQVTMESNSQLIINGTLDLWGYIKESSLNNGSQLFMNSTSYNYCPLIFYDYRGGAITEGLYYYNIFPISIFDFANIKVETTLYYGAQFYVRGAIYITNDLAAAGAGGKHLNIVELLFISTSEGQNSAPIQLNDTNAYINIKYQYGSNQNFLYTTNSTVNYTDIYIYGGANIVDLSFELGDTYNTNGKSFPLSYRLKLHLMSTPQSILNQYTFDVQTKFLPGSSLEVGEGATVNFNWNTLAYYNVSGVTMGDYNVNIRTDVKIINNGTINVVYSNSASGLGGIIESTSEGAQINFMGSCNHYGTSLIVTNFNSTTLGFYRDIDTTNLQRNAVGKTISFDDNGNVTSTNTTNQDLSGAAYESVLYNGVYYWEEKQVYSLSVGYDKANDENNSQFTITLSDGRTINQDDFSGSSNVTLSGIEPGTTYTISNLSNLGYLTIGGQNYGINDANNQTYTINSNVSINVVKKQKVTSLTIEKVRYQFVIYYYPKFTISFYDANQNGKTIKNDGSSITTDYNNTSTYGTYTYTSLDNLYIGDYVSIWLGSYVDIATLNSNNITSNTRYLITTTSISIYVKTTSIL